MSEMTPELAKAIQAVWVGLNAAQLEYPATIGDTNQVRFSMNGRSFLITVEEEQ